MARARTPDTGYTGSWVCTLGPLQVETTDLRAYKDPAPFEWDNVRIPKCNVSWGVGGAPFQAVIDWPLRGACFGLAGDFVELTYGLLFDSAVGPRAREVQYGQTYRVAAAVTPGQRAGTSAFGNPCFTFPSSDIRPDDGITRSMVYPAPDFAVAVQLIMSDLEYPEAANAVGTMLQFNQTGLVVRADFCQPLTAQTATQGLFAVPLHPCCAAVQWSSGFDIYSPVRSRVALRFILDLGSH